MEIQMVISLIAVIVSAGAAYFAWKQAHRVYQVNRHTENIIIT